MNIVLKALSFLETKEKLTLIGHTALRCATASLDLFGIYLLGVTVALLSGSDTKAPVVQAIVSVAAGFGFPNYYSIIAAIAAVTFVVKNFLSVFLNAYTANYVANLTGRKLGSLAGEVLPQAIQIGRSLTNHEIVFGLTGSSTALFGKSLINAIALLTELFLLAVVSIFMAMTNPIAFLLLAVGFGLLGLILNAIVGKKTEHHSSEIVASSVASGQILYEFIENSRQLWPMGLVDAFVEVFQRRYKRVLKSTANLSTLSLLPKVVIETSLIVGIGLIVLQRSLNPDLMSAADITIFIAGSFRLMSALLPIQGYLTVLRSTNSEAKMALDLSSFGLSPSGREVLENARDSTKPILEFENVTFAHGDKASPTIVDVNLILESPGLVGLVGGSGVGKSTIADLVTGILLPQQGFVLVHGQSPRSFIKDNPGKIAYVPQNTRLVHGSVGANVSMDPSQRFDSDQVTHALSQANCLEFVEKLADGVSTSIGPGGILLSGGQAQRLGLARVFYQNPDLVILDEVTSALDSATEKEVLEVIKELSKSKLVILITHNHKNLKFAQKVLELKDNRLILHESLDH